LARFERAIVFGSYLGSAERLGDLDVAIQWQRRETEYVHLRANNKKVAEEIRKGRHFSNMVEELDWWRREGILFLRNRKRGLSLHDYASDQKVVDSVPHRVVLFITERCQVNEKEQLSSLTHCTYKRGTMKQSVDERRIEFDWDEVNVHHVARHRVQPEEAEQVIINGPLDIGMEIVEGEEGFLNLGATSRGRILLVVTTWREDRVRVVTAFEPISRLVQFYFQERGR
jgi:uncharacterized DUF497 family protein